MPSICLPFSADFVPRLRHGVVEFPVHHMRGGTSTGLVLWEPFVPRALALREELLRHLMGVPLTGVQQGNRQLTGLGRGAATSNKVFLADLAAADGDGGPLLVSTLAQLASDHAAIDWSVNCGNMSSALQLWALDTGLVQAEQGRQSEKSEESEPAQHTELRIQNTNTNVLSISRMTRGADGRYTLAGIPGVNGAFPAVDLFMQAPVGAKTGQLLPTGAVTDVINGITVSCVDVAVPMVICDARAFGKTAHEPILELQADHQFMAALRRLWTEAGLRMKLARRDGTPMTAAELERSETIPKICIIGASQGQGNLAVRYFTPQQGHASMAVSGGCCLAAAALIPGSVAQQLARGVRPAGAEYADIAVGIENPAGVLDATVVARINGGQLEVHSAAYRRSTQILLRGHVPLYRASAALVGALL